MQSNPTKDLWHDTVTLGLNVFVRLSKKQSKQKMDTYNFQYMFLVLLCAIY